MKPTRIGVFDTEKAAYTACEMAINARDRSNPVSLGNRPSDALPCNLDRTVQITVVSDAFRRKNYLERAKLFYEVRCVIAMQNDLVNNAVFITRS